MIKKILLLLVASSESKPIVACHFGGGGGTANAHLACLRGGLVLKLLAAERNVSQR